MFFARGIIFCQLFPSIASAVRQIQSEIFKLDFLENEGFDGKISFFLFDTFFSTHRITSRLVDESWDTLYVLMGPLKEIVKETKCSVPSDVILTTGLRTELLLVKKESDVIFLEMLG